MKEARSWPSCYPVENFCSCEVNFESSSRLPDHHADPFDRLIVATAFQVGAAVITYDRLIRQYDVPYLD
ncbi:MAG: hypothetical protein JJU05_15010 [Verrucomicrobia bacterium]|nr:hypothetical protein [Verrucomicrobiota bacterium]MCH8528123.1 hypothetical protein [Kiritimatiellia bacterium]